MVEKYFQGNIPEARIKNAPERITDSLAGLSKEVIAFLGPDNDFNFSATLEKIWEIINLANKHVEETKPWNLLKESRTEELKSFIGLLVEIIKVVADNISPFMPQTAAAILEQFGEDRIKKGKPLFPRIDTKNNH